MPLDFIKSVIDKVNIDKADAVSPLRVESVAEFEKTGVPTAKHEEWKYINLSFLKKYDFQIYQPKTADFSELVEKTSFEGLETNRIVFINGVFSALTSNIIDEKGVIISSLSEAISQDSRLAEKLSFNKEYKQNPFEAVNTALFRDGVYVEIQAGAALDTPIHIISINAADEFPLINQPRNLIVARENSRATMIFSSVKAGGETAFENSMSEVFCESGAILDQYFIQNDPNLDYIINTVKVFQSKDSRYTLAAATVNAPFVRNNFSTKLSEPGAESNVYGFYFAKSRETADNRTVIDHASPDCRSDELFKGVLADEAKANFSGKILVRQDAQRTDAFQTNKNVLLSNKATINTKPQLEIYADDVKCSHGATSGNLDRESLFYLRSRGIDAKTAEALLLNAFSAEVVGKIKIPKVQAAITAEIIENLNTKELYFCDTL